MTNSELRIFLQRHNMSPTSFALVIGVTRMAVEHWLIGRRSVSLTVSRLCKLFDRKPELIREFIGEQPVGRPA